MILMMCLAMLPAAAQGHGHRHGHGQGNRHGHGNGRGQIHGRFDPRHGQPRPDRMLRDIHCEGDWQELWNGCHVRLMNDKVYILESDGDRLLWGDDIWLLPSGQYKVRRGDYWRIFDREGGITSIYGEELMAFPNGFFCVRFGGMWRVYTPDGDRLTGAWGDEITLMSNGLFRCLRNDRYYYYDTDGNQRD